MITTTRFIFRLALIMVVLGAGLAAWRPLAIPPPVPAQIVKVVDPRQLTCLAQAIFFEARGEGELGMAAVARVVMNRVRHGFGPNPCAVVYQKTKIPVDDGEHRVLCQFSWVCDDERQSPSGPQWVQARAIALAVLMHDAYATVLPRSVLFFHAVSANPEWTYKRVVEIGNHIFYRK